ncbi:restriction endonuclease [Cupriavidus basilensis]|uniref:Restriction endonuclease n=1 Tax=Cupriavidus basilensis TaxID=68895 RepID=A0A643FMC5_9BURK|nr:restriction endonuclease [Cupriavidus basilensis]QOT75733.1 restriction endonuclease [Cupriavidus basilensis]
MTLSTNSSGFQFEQLVRRILEANHFDVHEAGLSIGLETGKRAIVVSSSGGVRADANARGQSAGFDFTATMGNEIWAIEVKFYRTARAQVTLLESAAARLAARGIIAGARKGMLVVSCQLSSALRTTLEDRFSITFIDRVDLLNWAARAPELLDELNALLELDSIAIPEASERPTEPTQTSKRLPETSPPEDTKGTELCQELKALKRGKSTWSAYEKLCDRILRYLFPNDLHGWHRQKRTDDGLNRFDYICRIRPTTDFWQFLLHHLDSRYVLFEFKNYADKIKQGQILTTEKYLLERGLRRVAIVLSRAGASTDAIKMTQGAMREHGKLMLVIDDGQIIDMLQMKERGEDPTDRLFELADDFLLALPR